MEYMLVELYTGTLTTIYLSLGIRVVELYTGTVSIINLSHVICVSRIILIAVLWVHSYTFLLANIYISIKHTFYSHKKLRK